MKTIRAKFPVKSGQYFVHVEPAPGKDVNKFELSYSNENVTIETQKHVITAERNGYLIYVLDELSDYICKLSLGVTREELKVFLEREYRMHEKSKVCFYLFKKLTVTEKAKLPTGVGLPATV